MCFTCLCVMCDSTNTELLIEQFVSFCPRLNSLICSSVSSGADGQDFLETSLCFSRTNRRFLISCSTFRVVISKEVERQQIKPVQRMWRERALIYFIFLHRVFFIFSLPFCVKIAPTQRLSFLMQRDLAGLPAVSNSTASPGDKENQEPVQVTARMCENSLKPDTSFCYWCHCQHCHWFSYNLQLQKIHKYILFHQFKEMISFERL